MLVSSHKQNPGCAAPVAAGCTDLGYLFQNCADGSEITSGQLQWLLTKKKCEEPSSAPCTLPPTRDYVSKKFAFISRMAPDRSYQHVILHQRINHKLGLLPINDKMGSMYTSLWRRYVSFGSRPAGWVRNSKSKKDDQLRPSSFALSCSERLRIASYYRPARLGLPRGVGGL